MKLAKGFIIFLLIHTIISGCGMNHAGDNAQTAYDQNNTNIVNISNRKENINELRMAVAEGAQEKIESLPQVKSANVIVTNQNAFVAVVLNGHSEGEIRKDIEQVISDQVKSTDHKIENVYVSSNPDFIDRMEDYGERLEKSEPIEGIFDEFNETVQRIFPKAH